MEEKHQWFEPKIYHYPSLSIFKLIHPLEIGEQFHKNMDQMIPLIISILG